MNLRGYYEFIIGLVLLYLLDDKPIVCHQNYATTHRSVQNTSNDHSSAHGRDRTFTSTDNNNNKDLLAYSDQESDPKHSEASYTITRDDLFLIKQPSPNNSSHTRQIYDFKKAAYCLPTPQDLSFCSDKLGWNPSMAVPNLIGHKSGSEIQEMLFNARLNELASVRCNLELQLKLLLCSVLSPVCLDLIPPPCRQLCSTVKTSCETAIIRQGLEWPKFLDCRKFPRNPESCINRQPLVVQPSATLTNSDQPASINAGQTTSITLNGTSISKPVTNKRKSKKNRKTTTTTSTTTTTTAPPITTTQDDDDASETPDANSNTASSTKDGLNEEETTFSTTTDITPAQIPVVTPAVVKLDPEITVSQTTQIKQISNNSSGISESSDKAQTTLKPNHLDNESASTRQDYSSMPVDVTDDLRQLLCSRSPDWLIKTKLSDSQLMSAVSRRKLRIRSYLQIFGSFAAPTSVTDRTDGTTTPPILDHQTSASNMTTRKSNRNVATNLSLELSNTTVFVAAIGPHIYTQPINDALPLSVKAVNNQSSVPAAQQSSTKAKSSIRYYLVAGTGSANTLKTTTMFIVWPSSKSNLASDSQGNMNVVKTYREFKRKGALACNQSSIQPVLTNIDPDTQNESELATESPVSDTSASTTPHKQTTRKYKRKRIHQT